MSLRARTPAAPPSQRYFYLKSATNGRVFPYSEALARRADMEPFVPPKSRAAQPKAPEPVTVPTTESVTAPVTRTGKPDRRFKAPVTDEANTGQTNLLDAIANAAADEADDDTE